MEKRFDELPRYLQLMDVGIVPYVDSAFNRSSFPLKTLEYLAAGRPVVATGLPSVRWLESPDVSIADDAAMFADAVAAAVAQPRRECDVRRRQAFAGRHTWDERARAFAAIIDDRTGDDRTGDDRTRDDRTGDHRTTGRNNNRDNRRDAVLERTS